MYTGTILGAALALCGTTMAVPAANGLRPRDGDNDNDLQNAPWVTVDDQGAPRTTFTPTVTTVSGTPSTVNAAPHDLTATVYTMTNYGHVYTTTQAPPNPMATNDKTNEGAFSRCYNKEGPYAPFCRPRHNSSIYIDNTYYVTWDPDWFNKTSNKTRFVSLRINYFNETTGEKSDRDILEQWQPARYGFLPFKVEGRHLRGHSSNNVTLQLVGHEIQNTTAPTMDTVELPVVIAKAPLDPTPPSHAPKGQTLVIALPVTFGAIALLVVGLCLWNHKTRRIQLGNVMSRSRRGYTGRRTRNLLNRKNDGIQLGAPVSPPVDYRDLPERPRRDSEALGSLSGSPVRAHFEEQDTTGGRRNAFRDEVGRQERERRTGY
ncbi:hypothetical protein EsDP_00004514 [Epichloe bromicola]|uniref:Uncharacterized protein n=1 Tax=Epichloe bromicola TaxID=79588 RepID=A0ABQ0CRX8_9HYPO